MYNSRVFMQLLTIKPNSDSFETFKGCVKGTLTCVQSKIYCEFNMDCYSEGLRSCKQRAG